MSEAVRLVVCDVDGTLVDKDKKLTAATTDAVKRLTTAGVAFTIISARPMSGMMPIAEALELNGAMGAFNGGLMFRRDGTVMEHHTIDERVARGMFDLVGDAKVDRWVFADDIWHASTDQGVHVAHERIASNQAPIVTDDFDALLHHADKITFVSDDEALLARLHELAKAAFDGRATVAQSQTYYLDVTATEANKGAGVTALAAAFDTPLSEIVAIGDQANDVAMLDFAGVSIAMGNAPDAVKKGVDHITRGNDENGVAHAIDEFILPKIGVSA